MYAIRSYYVSKKCGTRLFRHLVFWSCCWLYGSLTYYFLQEFEMGKNGVSPGAFILFKTLMLTFAYTIPCYTFIYVILPAFVNGKWVQAVAILLPLLCLMYVITSYSIHYTKLYDIIYPPSKVARIELAKSIPEPP